MSTCKYALGKQSIKFANPIFLKDGFSVVGKKEGEGPLSPYFDIILEDELNGCNTWEEAESTLQHMAVEKIIEKTAVPISKIRYLLGGDLLGQSIVSTFGLMQFDLPYLGLYGACSTCGLSLSLGSILISGGFAENVICVTSSHFASAEKEFRFPLNYGNQRPLSATWTVTGSGAFLLSNEKGYQSKAKITGVTTGKIIDYGIKDAMNMGACMAPAAADVFATHLKDFSIPANYYDAIYTGDLGDVGRTAFLDLLSQKDILIADLHHDCGLEIFNNKVQNTQSGGSGCGCSATVLASYILHQLDAGIWKRVLFIPTGALLSKTSFNEGKSIPGIAHAVILESADN